MWVDVFGITKNKNFPLRFYMWTMQILILNSKERFHTLDSYSTLPKQRKSLSDQET